MGSRCGYPARGPLVTTSLDEDGIMSLAMHDPARSCIYFALNQNDSKFKFAYSDRTNPQYQWGFVHKTFDWPAAAHGETTDTAALFAKGVAAEYGLRKPLESLSISIFKFDVLNKDALFLFRPDWSTSEEAVAVNLRTKEATYFPKLSLQPEELIDLGPAEGNPLKVASNATLKVS